jgi:hypothetical protein
VNTVCMFFLCANKETAVSAASKEVARGGRVRRFGIHAPWSGPREEGLRSKFIHTLERECCLLVLNLVSSTLPCIRQPRPRL